MQIRHATLDTCHTAADTVVVIDVIRAFTTAAFAFDAGAAEIIPVSSVCEALTLRRQFPGSLVMGEVDGLPPEVFDYGNSPAALIGQDLAGKRSIQRTSAGTQGVTRSAKAAILLAASFVCAAATARFVRELASARVTLVSTGQEDEDRACADYLERLLQGHQPDPTPYLQRARMAGQARLDHPSASLPADVVAGFTADLQCCLDLDRFDFAMPIGRRDELPVMTPWRYGT